jgi:hypothetical protein
VWRLLRWALAAGLRQTRGMSNALLVAAGGGGDALAALFVHQALSSSSEMPVIASYSWDRFLLDPQPGPRCPADFHGLSQITARNWEVTPASYLVSGGQSTLTMLARHTSARFVLLDPREGAAGLRAQLAELVSELAAIHVTLVDVGGDVVAQGREPELLSPLADSMTLAALGSSDLPAQVAIAGPGLDGELAPATVRQRCADLGDHLHELLPAHVEPYLGALARHPSEASNLLAAAAFGVRGQAEIRDLAALVRVDDQSATIHVVEPSVLLKANEIANQMTMTKSLDEAEQVVISVRHRSELTHERRKAYDSRHRSEMPDRPELARRYASYRQDAMSRGVSLLTFRHLAEVVGMSEYNPSLIRSLTATDAHRHLAICQLRER